MGLNSRELASMTSGSTTWSFTYDADGMRTKRTNGSTTYNYVYNGSQLSHMSVGSNNLYFLYDASGSPVAVIYNGVRYNYVTNLQGDVVKIRNTSGTDVVTYTYDAWGRLLNTTGSLASTLGTHNPLRYRGYVYDHETGLYYLQSRYYNPALCRFLNADALASTGQGILGNNMFAYCLNSPVILEDHFGNASMVSFDDRGNNIKMPWIGGGGGGAILDVTREVIEALEKMVEHTSLVKSFSKLLFGDNEIGFAMICYDFYTQVNHNAPWDIKRSESWYKTIGTLYPGRNCSVMFAGKK